MIYEGVEPIDVGGTLGVVSMARRILPQVEAVIIAREAGPVRLAGGMTVLAHRGIEAVPPCDVIIVCGGPGRPKAASDSKLLRFLQGLPPEHVASVCTGALILAAAGVLDGRSATTRRHAVGGELVAPLDRLGQHQTIRPRVAVVVDDGVVTGGGVSLAIDVTLYLLGRIYDESAAAEVARVIEYDRAYAANRAALGVYIGDRGRDATGWTAITDRPRTDPDVPN